MNRKLYAFSKVFHFHSKLGDMEQGRITPPVHVRLKPTNRCNHACSYCCYRNPGLFLSELVDVRDEIPWPKMTEIIADLGRVGVKAVTLSGGGEPLCYPYAAELIRTLSDSGIKVAMLTNGALLEGEAARIAAERAVWVRVSMDAADRDSYARIRRVAPAEFDRVCGNIRTFASINNRKAVLGVNFIVTAESSGRVYDFLAMAKKLGADNVKVSAAVTSTNPDLDAAYLSPFFKTVKTAIVEAARELEDGKFVVIDRFHMPDSSGGENYSKQYTRCPMAEFLTAIGADLNVYACQDKAYTRSGLLGSITDKSYAQLIASDDYAKRLRGINPSLNCRHHCTAHEKNMTLLDYLESDAAHMEFV